MQQKITPSFWFDGIAKEAIDFYISIFPDSKIGYIMYYPKTAAEGLADFQKDMAGKELAIEFYLSGLRFMAINASSEFKFNESISFTVSCKDQAEIDKYWEKLSSVPEAEQCGWCKDKYGVSWQIVPENISELLASPKGYTNLMSMKKLVIADF